MSLLKMQNKQQQIQSEWDQLTTEEQSKLGWDQNAFDKASTTYMHLRNQKTLVSIGHESSYTNQQDQLEKEFKEAEQTFNSLIKLRCKIQLQFKQQQDENQKNKAISKDFSTFTVDQLKQLTHADEKFECSKVIIAGIHQRYLEKTKAPMDIIEDKL